MSGVVPISGSGFFVIGDFLVWFLENDHDGMQCLLATTECLLACRAHLAMLRYYSIPPKGSLNG